MGGEARNNITKESTEIVRAIKNGRSGPDYIHREQVRISESNEDGELSTLVRVTSRRVLSDTRRYAV